MGGKVAGNFDNTIAPPMDPTPAPATARTMSFLLTGWVAARRARRAARFAFTYTLLIFVFVTVRVFARPADLMRLAIFRPLFFDVY
jgi:hypothetical protein